MANPKNKFKNKEFLLLIAFIVILQIFFFSYNQIQLNNLTSQISENNKKLNEETISIEFEINSIKQELDMLDESIVSTQDSILKTQSDLEKQISSIKAQTSSDFSGIIENAIESVVSIQTNAGQGTGFIITNDGYVVTNAHVLEGARFANAITIDQQKIPMSLIGFSSNLDLVLLKIEGEYDFLELENSDNINVGEKVIAIGNPFGLSFSASEGIISATGRTVNEFEGEYIQTDAALNAGNSGGPLINTQGKVIGVNNFKIEGDNIGFALESNFAREEINRISLEKIGNEII
jgi:S1-C subfamily serine protease